MFVLLVAAASAGCLSNEMVPPSGGGGVLGDGAIVDGGGADAGGTVGPDAGEAPIDGGVLRHYTFRALSGVSMGASATGFIGGRHPDKFDFVGALGGYINMVYLLHMIKDRKLAGFCEMEQILANLADVNDPDKNSAIYCGPVRADQVYKGHVYENTEDFNHWFFADYSAEFDRSEAIEIFQDLSMGMGNAFFHNAESPYLPSGVGPVPFKAWMDDPLKCDAGHEFTIDTKPYNCNREFNPGCEYPLVLFCDGEEPVGCKNGKCGKDNPDYYTLKGSYDPYYPDHRQPVIVMAAVDYNRNGRRDFGEPLVINYGERFSDTGLDGCRTVFEDAKGGCCWDEGYRNGTCDRPWDPITNPDPNHDDYDWLANPTGMEMNWLYDEGEPYEDFGVDGVKADEAKGIAPDYGEGNGTFDYSPRVANWLEHDIAMNFVKLIASNPRALDNIDVYIDGGIRDIFNSGVASYHAAGRMQGAGIPFKVYDHFLGLKNSVMPDVLKDGDYMNLIPDADFSPSAFGKNALVLYGKPDASDKEIKNGDGGHVGTVPQAVDRFLTWFSFVSQRWPKGDRRPSESSLAGLTRSSWYRSKSLDGWRRYTISLPPGYGDPGNEKRTYPVVYFMHGYGMAPGDMGATGIIFQGYMADGRFQKFITVYPDGKCCLYNKATGARDCSCIDKPGDGSMYLCVNAQGAEVSVPRSTLPERECNSGTFYLDMVADRYGDPAAAAVMKYEGSILDLIDHVDATYRTKAPADLIAPR